MLRKLGAISIVGIFALTVMGTNMVNANGPPQVDFIADGGDEYLDIGDIIYGEFVDGGYTYFAVIIFLDGDWQLNETHVHVTNGSDGDPIPVNGNNNPKVGKFEYKNETHYMYPGTQYYYYIINVTEEGWLQGDTLSIAFHAEVWNETAWREESAWGEGTQFNEGKNWAMYFNYVIGTYVEID